MHWTGMRAWMQACVSAVMECAPCLCRRCLHCHPAHPPNHVPYHPPVTLPPLVRLPAAPSRQVGAPRSPQAARRLQGPLRARPAAGRAPSQGAPPRALPPPAPLGRRRRIRRRRHERRSWWRRIWGARGAIARGSGGLWGGGCFWRGVRVAIPWDSGRVWDAAGGGCAGQDVFQV